MNFESYEFRVGTRIGKRRSGRVRKFSPGINNFIHEEGEGERASVVPSEQSYLLSSLLLNYVF